MTLLQFGSAYVVALLVVGLLDALWLGWLAKDFYRRELGALMVDAVRLAPAAAFYFLYPLGLVFVALQPVPATLGEAMLRCGALGLLAYGTYDLTNLATLRDWSVRLSLVDMAWGALLSALAGGAAWAVVLRNADAA